MISYALLASPLAGWEKTGSLLAFFVVKTDIKTITGEGKKRIVDDVVHVLQHTYILL